VELNIMRGFIGIRNSILIGYSSGKLSENVGGSRDTTIYSARESTSLSPSYIALSGWWWGVEDKQAKAQPLHKENHQESM